MESTESPHAKSHLKWMESEEFWNKVGALPRCRFYRCKQYWLAQPSTWKENPLPENIPFKSGNSPCDVFHHKHFLFLIGGWGGD